MTISAPHPHRLIHASLTRVGLEIVIGTAMIGKEKSGHERATEIEIVTDQCDESSIEAKRETGPDTLVSLAREKTDDSTQPVVRLPHIGTATEKTPIHNTIGRDSTSVDTA